MRRRPALFASIAALFAAPATNFASGEKTVMDDAHQLLAIVDRLVEARPLTAAATGRLVGANLSPVGDQSTERKLVYATQGTTDFDRVELRLPGPKSTNSGQFLMLEVNARRCVQMAIVQARYGQPELSVPTPRQPVDAPVYLKFQREWGTLSFGFARSGAECLRTVVVDVAPAK